VHDRQTTMPYSSMNAKGNLTDHSRRFLRGRAIGLAAAIQELIWTATHECGDLRQEKAREQFADALVSLGND